MNTSKYRIDYHWILFFAGILNQKFKWRSFNRTHFCLKATHCLCFLELHQVLMNKSLNLWYVSCYVRDTNGVTLATGNWTHAEKSTLILMWCLQHYICNLKIIVHGKGCHDSWAQDASFQNPEHATHRWTMLEALPWRSALPTCSCPLQIDC